jgi:hypothetical protein
VAERSRGECLRPARLRRLSHAPVSLVISGLLICAVASGCADQTEGGPQFANEPAPPRATSRVIRVGSPAPLPTVAPAATPVATPSSLADLLRGRGAPKAIFLAVDDVIWSITGEGDGTRVFVAPDGAEIRAFDASPAADGAAILLRGSEVSRSSYAVVVVDGHGDVRERFDDLPPGPATPGGASVSSVDIIDWSPQGDRLLATYADGETVILPLEEGVEVEPVSLADAEKTAVDAAWSPTGEAVAYIASGGREADRALWVLDARSNRKKELVGARDNRFVVEFSWLPDGTALLFTEGGNLEGAVTGIDLWRVDANGANRQLVASAGSVAPVARITDIRPSPDGRAVAYAVLVPGDGRPRVDSVWVRDLTSRVGFKVALPTVMSVDEIGWTDRGLAIAVTTSGAGRSRAPASAVLQVTGDGQVSALWVAPIPTPATPEGTPAATPGLD